MTHAHRKIEVVGTCTESLEGAIRNAIELATKTTGTLEWFEVTEIRGRLADEKIDELQVTVKVGLREG